MSCDFSEKPAAIWILKIVYVFISYTIKNAALGLYMADIKIVTSIV